MKNIFSLYKLRMLMCFKNAILVIPTVITAVFLGFMYSLKPSQISASFLISGLFLFVLCVYISMMIAAKENDIQEQVLYLHCRSDVAYYISRELVLLTICIMYSIIIIIYPVISAHYSSDFFTRALETSDIILGGGLIFGNGLLGMAVGDFFHHRIIRMRRNAVLFLMLLIAVAICKFAIIHAFSYFRYISFLLPPVMDGFDMVGNSDIFDKTKTIYILIHVLLFVLAATILKIGILKHKKY